MNQSNEDFGLRRSKRNTQSNSGLAVTSVTHSGDSDNEETDSRKRKRDGKRREGDKTKYI